MGIIADAHVFVILAEQVVVSPFIFILRSYLDRMPPALHAITTAFWMTVGMGG